MRFIVTGISMVLFSVSAIAASLPETYLCTAQLPQGNAEVVIHEGLNVGKTISLNFYNEARNQTYIGTLKVTDSSENGEFISEGNVLAYEQHPSIHVVLSGSVNPTNDDVISLQLYASGDKRIENGFGNILHCQKH